VTVNGTRTRAHRHRPLRSRQPMIDIYATPGTFADTHQLATDAAATVMRVEHGNAFLCP
jgi:hypothetical protein